MEIADLYVTLRGVTSEFTDSMAESGAAADAADGKIAGLMAGMAKLALGATAAAVGVGVASIDMASKFDAAMTQISTLAGVPQSQLAGLSSAVLDLAGKVGEDPDSLAAALYHVESSFQSVGITSQGAMNILQVAAEGARVGGANLVDVTNALDAAIASGIPGVQNYQQAMGALLKIVGSGDMTMQDFADAASTGILATAKVYGASLTDVGAALATFGDNNIRGQNAATDLRMSIMDLTKQAAPGAAALEKIGIQAGQLGTDMQTGGLNKALTDLHDHLVAAGDGGANMGQVLEDAFTKKSSAPLAILLSQFDRLESKYPDINAGAANFGNAWAATQNTLKQQWAEILDGAKSVGIRLGEYLTPKAVDLIQGIKQLASDVKGPMADVWAGLNASGGGDPASAFTKIGADIRAALADVMSVAHTVIGNLVGVFSDLWTIAKPLTPIFETLAAGVVVLFNALGPLSAVLKTVADFLAAHKVVMDAIIVAVGAAAAVWVVWTAAIAVWTAVTKAAIAIQAALDAVMDANPVMLIVIAIAALAAGLIYAYDHSKSFRDVIDDIGNALKTMWTDVLAPVVDFLANHWQPVLIAVVAATLPFLALPLAIYLYWGDIVSFFKTLGSDLASVFETIGTDIVHAVLAWNIAILKALLFFVEIPKKIYDYVVSQGGLIGIGAKVMSAFLDGIEAGAVAVKDWFTALPGVITGMLSDAGTWLVNLGKDLIQGWLNGNIAAAKLVWDWLRALPGEVKGLLADAGSWLYNAGVAVISGWWNGLVAEYRTAKAWVLQIPGDLSGALANIGSWFVQIGKDIINGLISGMGDIGSIIGNKLKSGLQSAISGAKSFLGISSPSKYMAEQIGQWLPAGVAAGITANTAQVSAAMTNMITGANKFGAQGVGVRVGGSIATAYGHSGVSGTGGQTNITNLNVPSGAVVVDMNGLWKLMQQAALSSQGGGGSRNAQVRAAFGGSR